MHEDQFWMVVSLMLSGEASREELDRVDAYLKDHPETRKRFLLLQSLWNTKPPASEAAADQAFNRHMQRLSSHLAEPVLQYEKPVSTETLVARNPKRVRVRRMIFATTAVASLLICVISVYLYHPPHKVSAATPQNTVSTRRGSRSKIELPDGTQVWLNTDSKLKYDEKFAGDTRSVQLSGEAYFDVAKDKDHPFIIHTATIDIKVLGTAFNVRSYQNEKNTETSLFRGSVEIIAHNNPERRIILKPLEKLIMQNAPPAVDQGKRAATTHPESEDKPLMTITTVHMEAKDSAAKDILWTRNKLSFDSEPLEEVALKIERWFDVKVSITDDKLKSKEYSATFDYENLRQVMEALRITGNFKYTIDKKEVIIRP